jgi:aminoglycoside phosphotransferase (APT) family kinase protein
VTTVREDAAADVRPGEELDLGALAAFLRDRLQLDGPVQVQQFPRGFSNLTYLVTVGDLELVLRRPPAGVAKGVAHDMGREFRILRALHRAGVAVPEPLTDGDEAAGLGAPFYVMRRVRGVILRQPSPALAAVLSPKTMQQLGHAFVETLASIHEVPREAEGIAELGKPDGYVRRQVEGWTARWQRARTDDVGDMEALAAWLAARAPAESGAALVHNDFKYDNCLLDPADLTRIVAVLDWEMATVGDPLLDLGTSLGYWLEAGDPPELMALGLGITALPGSPSRAALWAAYGVRRGLAMPPMAWYRAFGLFKIAVIAQQIYARWKTGHAKDPRFGALLGAVRLLAAQGAAAASG